MYLVTAEQMRQIDRYTIDTIGIPAAVLMENAGRATAEEVLRICNTLADSEQRKPWLVLVGKGHNGADGLVAARHLHEHGAAVSLLYAFPPDTLHGEPARQRDIIRHWPIPAGVYEPGAMDWSRFAGVVDALLGTGFKGAPREPLASLIREANASGLPIVALDLPSGLDADTGLAAEPCIRASSTVALAFLKRGQVQQPGAALCGQITVQPIGIPLHLAERFQVSARLATKTEITREWGDPHAPRQADAHKGTYGHAVMAAGSLAYSGAGLLATRAALRIGTGLVTWAHPGKLTERLFGLAAEAILQGLPDQGSGEWRSVAPEALAALTVGKQALVLGPGLGRFEGDKAWLKQVWEHTDVPLLLDADALNMLAAAEDFTGWKKRSQPAILTPHPGEMARLSRMTAREVQQNRIAAASGFAQEHGVILVLKGANTVTASPTGRIWVNSTGNPGMAAGGSGDVLAGVIGGLLAQGYEPEAAAVIGVWQHGAAGDKVRDARQSERSLLAGDIVEAL
ncbi:NAD(P)H-hydrate dehydratase [Xylanibacillus composti]|uniref:Bifunctional NAD(P)H-hydrate repair enzyme n=1 Tax=Xylanibacillus composti TaxID=1572762 RepID=A0A8J4M3N7_9BACL|nr:NAD(P)H-hydrate dehydratase [Xylanibacillus composti]MDT9723690.1 NAD(P)H-hydrate dehydratase [Xylanibacillus composti]GIQ71029.1 bifunctional NAD(P)H-hydrate repair enzyme Nnr [Xylanibacillus composti]